MDYIADYVQEIEDLILAEDEEFLKYIDLESFVLRYLVDEVALNYDTGVTSMYFYKEQDDPLLYAGPVWDYDGSLGAGGFSNPEVLAALEIQDYRRESSLTWYPYLYQNPVFYERAVSEYQESVRPYILKMIERGLDEYADTVKPSVELDRIRWPYDKYHAGYYEQYENNIRYLRYFLGKRLSFLDRIWLGEENSYVPEGTGEKHQVTFIGSEKTESFEETDGNCVVATPEYLLKEGEWWFHTRTGLPFLPYYPVFEDVAYEAAVGY